MDENHSEETELFYIMDRLHCAWKNITPRQNLSKAQFGTLFTIYKKGMENGIYSVTDARPVTLTELAASVWQSLPALSQRIYALEMLGYVKRMSNPNDRRVICLTLTKNGLIATENAKKRLEEILKQAFDRLGVDAETLIKLLTKLAEAFEYVIEEEEKKNGKK